MTVDENSVPKHPADAQFAALLAAHARQTYADHPEVADLADALVGVAGEHGLYSCIPALVTLAINIVTSWSANDPKNRLQILSLGKECFAFGHNKVGTFEQTGKPDHTEVAAYTTGGRA